MKVVILGGGLSAVSLAYNIMDRSNIDEIIIIEKEDKLGGLCRSYKMDNVVYDVGPHIIFSKDEQVLEHMKTMLKDNIHMKRRSNQIIHKGTLIQYPFENDLSKLNDKDKFYAINAFINNPYENYNPENMHQFFLKTFGEGITNLYLRPYNEKIWKFDPSYMNTRMVERIPKPPKEDILASANGKTIDGYLHQLYFYYPNNGGMESLVKAYISKFNKKIKIMTNSHIESINKENNVFKIKLSDETILTDTLVSTIPIGEFTELYKRTPKRVFTSSHNLKYNSIIIGIVQVSKDLSGDNFAFYVADSSIIFHRISKLDFLGDNYHEDGKVTYMVEITYRENDIYDKMSDTEILDNIKNGLKKIGFITDDKDILKTNLKRFKYAYVIYDIDYEKNIKIVRRYFEKEKIYLHGRFGNFEYINMDRVIKDSMDLSNNIK